ncbi:MAG: hypothetical protein ACRCZG_06570, partial [Culicoidibacterales bacterium]
MQFDFLGKFPVRMKKVGAYAMLFRNSFSKTTWKIYGFEAYHEQVNIIFSVLLFVMECSLRESICTIDDIAGYLDQLNMRYYQKTLSYEQAKELAIFILDVILGNEGRPMYFEGYSYEECCYLPLYVSFVGNKIVYINQEVKRTSYFLSDEGYELMLSTLEIDSHLQLTIQEMIFKLHLEKATYDKAVDDIKQIFNLLRMQFQKIEGAMRKIRQNALAYTIEEYREIVEQNLEVIETTKEKFLSYRNLITHLISDLEEKNVTIEKLIGEDAANFGYLKIIEQYLGQVLGEHQRILNSHFDLKSLYTKELEGLTQMSMIKRYHFRSEVYDKLLQAPVLLDEMAGFLQPLFSAPMDKTYNLAKSLEYQRNIGKVQQEAAFFATVEETFDESLFQKQQQVYLAKYEGCLSVLLKYVIAKKKITLQQIKVCLQADDHSRLLPNTEIFKEVMIELLQAKTLDIPELQQDRAQHLTEQSGQFQLTTVV